MRGVLARPVYVRTGRGEGTDEHGTAIHYNRQIVYILRFMTHAEYDLGNQKWRRHL
jgi:hypothetical protein